jgi:hypothetical protein
LLHGCSRVPENGLAAGAGQLTATSTPTSSFWLVAEMYSPVPIENAPSYQRRHAGQHHRVHHRAATNDENPK